MATKLWSAVWKGTYAGGTSYTIGDFVLYNGSTYTCIANSTGNLPTNGTYWVQVASKGDTGATGSTGATGATGSAGADGSDGDKGGIRYNFSTTTTDSDPGQGVFRYNNATIGSVTQIYIDIADQGGVDISSYIDSWDDSTNTVKGYLEIKSNTLGDATLNIWQVDSWTTASGYRKLGVTYVSGALPSDSEPCVISFHRAGNKGADGAGSGDVIKVGTPVNNQVGVWTGDGTLEGDTALTFDTTTDTLTTGTVNSTSLTASEMVITDGSKNLVSAPVATYPSLTELSYVKGLTSAVQTQLNTKAPSTSPTLVTPALGTPTSGVLTNCTGTATGLTSGITNALKSATTTVDVSAATAPTSGQVLTATSSTTATWQTPSAGGTDYSCRVYQTGTTSVTSSWVALAFAAENFDTDTMHDNATNNTRITFTHAGKYMVGGGWYGATNTPTGTRIKLNGTTVIASQVDGNAGVNLEFSQVSTFYNFSASDYIELEGYSNTTQNSSGDAQTHFWAYRVAA